MQLVYFVTWDISEALEAFKLFKGMLKAASLLFGRSNIPQINFQSIFVLILQPRSQLNSLEAFFDLSKFLLRLREGSFSMNYYSMASWSLLEAELFLLFGWIIRDFQFQKKIFYCLVSRSQIRRVRFSLMLKRLIMSSQSSTLILI